MLTWYKRSILIRQLEFERNTTWSFFLLENHVRGTMPPPPPPVKFVSLTPVHASEKNLTNRGKAVIKQTLLRDGRN